MTSENFMRTFRSTCRTSCSAILCSGIAAGLAATLVQVALWLAVGADFSSLLLRDARLTAALVLGRGVLPPPATFDAEVWVVATLVHFALSVAYAALLMLLVTHRARFTALLAGAIFGAVLYGVNLYGFVELFPWFAEARGWITLLAHVAFGMTAVAVQFAAPFKSGQLP